MATYSNHFRHLNIYENPKYIKVTMFVLIMVRCVLLGVLSPISIYKLSKKYAC